MYKGRVEEIFFYLTEESCKYSLANLLLGLGIFMHSKNKLIVRWWITQIIVTLWMRKLQQINLFNPSWCFTLIPLQAVVVNMQNSILLIWSCDWFSHSPSERPCEKSHQKSVILIESQVVLLVIRKGRVGCEWKNALFQKRMNWH